VKIKNLFLIVLLVLLVSPIFADEKKEENPIKLWAYFQPMSEWTKDARTFSISKGRGFVNGRIGDNIFYLVEAEVVPVTRLVKFQFEYRFGSQKIILGQQSNSFKFYNPDPSQRITINYPLSSLTIANLDDLGLTWQGDLWKFNYRLSMLNGKGANYRDDNKDKDTVAFVKFSPLKQISFIGCWQGGWQEWTSEIEQRHYREGYWFQAEIKPIKSLLIKPTYVRRNDLEKDGWFVLGLLTLNSKYQALVQYVKDGNEESEWTFGTIVKSNHRMRLLVNGLLRRTVEGETDLGLYIMTQINIGKDL
jgi:hypothetical protein